MKNLLRFAVAGALMAGYATAQAQSLPSTGSSDLWLFVSDQSAGTTFAEDTGVSLTSLMPTTYTTGTKLNTTAKSDTFSVAATSALTAYINAASSAGQTLDWAVLGDNYPGTPTGTGFKNAGTTVAVFSSDPALSSKVSSMNLAPGLNSVDNGFEGDLAYLTTNGYVAGGATYAFSAGSTAGNVWGSTGTGGQAGSTNLYNQGPDQSGIGLGTAVSLYGVTGNGNNSTVQSYVLGDNLTLSASGLLSVAAGSVTPPVPLPAAVWLFGSGLLGLLGVGRRRAAAV